MTEETIRMGGRIILTNVFTLTCHKKKDKLKCRIDQASGSQQFSVSDVSFGKDIGHSFFHITPRMTEVAFIRAECEIIPYSDTEPTMGRTRLVCKNAGPLRVSSVR